MSHEPFFYIAQLSEQDQTVFLDEGNSKHVALVLRKQAGEKVMLTDGKGNSCLAEIITPHKKKTELKVLERSAQPAPPKSVTIAISLIKNPGRFEWFLEKAAEIGVRRIQPLICERTEKQHFKNERWQQILTSAMLQSEQRWMTELASPKKFGDFLSSTSASDSKFIAHCLDGKKNSLVAGLNNPSSVILIGPEGDFTSGEVEDAILRGYVPVSLGNNRLRTETAGIVAASLLLI